MDSPSKGWRENILSQLKQRNRTEVAPFQGLLMLQARMSERSSQLQQDMSSLLTANQRLQEEKVQLEALLLAKTAATQLADSQTLHDLQMKIFNLQEELTELHRRKGENAQQVIDLSVALKAAEKEASEKQKKIDSLEAQLICLTEDIKFALAKSKELEETNQLLKDEYQALQLALNSTEEKFRNIHRENQTLIVQLMQLKAQDADRMNLENDLFALKKQQIVQIELAEAAREQKSITPEIPDSHFVPPAACVGVSLPTKVALKFDAHDAEATAVRWDLSGHCLATAGADRKIKIWEVGKSGQAECRATLVGSNNALMSVDFDSSGTMLVGASNDFAARIWTVDDCRLRHVLTGHSEKVMSAKFFVDSNRVVSGSHDRTLKIWDLRSKACITTKYPGSSCNDVVTTELTVVISAHFDKKVRFWDIRSSSTEPAHEVLLGGKVTSLDLTRDGNRLAICCRDDSLKVLDLRMNSVVGTYTSECFHVGCDWSRVSFSPDGEFVAAGAGDGGVYVWNVASGALAGVLRSHTTCVNAVSWHPGGTSIASVEKGKACIIWSDYL